MTTQLAPTDVRQMPGFVRIGDLATAKGNAASLNRKFGELATEIKQSGRIAAKRYSQLKTNVNRNHREAMRAIDKVDTAVKNLTAAHPTHVARVPVPINAPKFAAGGATPVAGAATPVANDNTEKISRLMALFPGRDVEALTGVLSAYGGDVEKAAAALRGMVQGAKQPDVPKGTPIPRNPPGPDPGATPGRKRPPPFQQIPLGERAGAAAARLYESFVDRVGNKAPRPLDTLNTNFITKYRNRQGQIVPPGLRAFAREVDNQNPATLNALLFAWNILNDTFQIPEDKREQYAKLYRAYDGYKWANAAANGTLTFKDDEPMVMHFAQNPLLDEQFAAEEEEEEGGGPEVLKPTNAVDVDRNTPPQATHVYKDNEGDYFIMASQEKMRAVNKKEKTKEVGFLKIAERHEDNTFTISDDWTSWADFVDNWPERFSWFYPVGKQATTKKDWEQRLRDDSEE